MSSLFEGSDLSITDIANALKEEPVSTLFFLLSIFEDEPILPIILVRFIKHLSIN